jgi:hypothetical protein
MEFEAGPLARQCQISLRKTNKFAPFIITIHHKLNEGISTN